MNPSRQVWALLDGPIWRPSRAPLRIGENREFEEKVLRRGSPALQAEPKDSPPPSPHPIHPHRRTGTQSTRPDWKVSDSCEDDWRQRRGPSAQVESRPTAAPSWEKLDLRCGRPGDPLSSGGASPPLRPQALR
ncbi:hypothetical protein P7K49_011889 [Saguinus oedipus]|uniref:Uncharacterized protein n=1 Tax=Saguinus oedipus TaxID=9490 RepID=A0ABQ9VRX9_SAGOE|nr:hypothetical protein P7K49_011889 [Saguinus oedipus]